MDNYIIIVNQDDGISLSDFMDNNNIFNGTQTADDLGLIVTNSFLPEDLFNYLNNQNNIAAAYLPEDGTIADINNIRKGTNIQVPIDRIIKETESIASNLEVKTSGVDAFIDSRIKLMFQNPSYKPINFQISTKDIIYRINNSISVWIWSKTLGTNTEKGKLINVTPFVQNLQTNVGANGGGFSFSLAPIVAKFLEHKGQTQTFQLGNESTALGNGGQGVLTNGQFNLSGISVEQKGGEWIIDDSTIKEYAYGGIRNIVSRASTHRKKANSNGSTNSEDTQIVRQNYFFHNVLTANDVVFIRFEALETEAQERTKPIPDILNSLTLHPSDLGGNVIPLLLDTNSEIDIENVSIPKTFDMIGLIDGNNIISNEQGADIRIEITGRDLTKLLIEDGCYFYPTATGNFPILGGYNNHTGNYPQNRIIAGNDNFSLPFFNAYLDQKIDYSLQFLFFLLSNIEIVDESLFQYIQDLTTKADFTGESLAANVQPPFLNSLSNVKVAGIWQIIKLVFDPQLENRRIVDTSICTDSGSLLNFVNKVCQKEFVEFYGDTYLDKYYFFVRKPPFDQKSIQSIIDNKFIIDVEEDSVYHDNLEFNDDAAYSWYRLQPQGNLFGDSVFSVLSQYLVVFFPEYAKIWGSRPYEVVTNYVDFKGWTRFTSEGSKNFNYMINQCQQDLGYLIESNAYLPFTRKGTITIKGDRRIKRGNFIRYKGTGEIFYVESVSNTWVIDSNSDDRETILTVSRGMFEASLSLYFNIIEFNKDTAGNYGSVSSFKVKPNIFNYFLKRRQMI